MVKIETEYVRKCLMDTLNNMTTESLIEHIIYNGDLGVFDNEELTRAERDDYYRGVETQGIENSEMKTIIRDWLIHHDFAK